MASFYIIFFNNSYLYAQQQGDAPLRQKNLPGRPSRVAAQSFIVI